MSANQHYQGQRLSLKGQTCTVRYVGPVDGKSGDWLGVEWDDPQRGKHDGTHEDKQYFQCRSKSRTSASFLRPTQAWDQPRTFLQALTDKYMSADTHDAEAEIVYFSGKQAEEVGFSKFSRRQAKLQGIHVLVLDRMRIKYTLPASEYDRQTIMELCADITVLDLSGNLFESFDEITRLCELFPKLQSLTLNYNHFAAAGPYVGSQLSRVRTVALSGTLLSEEEFAHVLSAFPSMTELEYTYNELSSWTNPVPCAYLTILDLSNNVFASLSDVKLLDQRCPDLRTLILKNNRISAVGPDIAFPSRLRELSVPDNDINTWTFINDLLPIANLHSLRLTGNPLYNDLHSADNKPLTASDGYMLTIARLPQLETLNYSKVSEKERLNAETYYLGQIAIELGQASEGEDGLVVARHPRYRGLSEEYGEPIVRKRVKKEELDPRSLAARLVTVQLKLAKEALPEFEQRALQAELPKSLDVYAILGLVGKKLGVSPLSLELVLETGERDLTARDSGYGGPEWWDSDEDEEGPGPKIKEWKAREIVLLPSTRALGTYVEGRKATINVRIK